MAKRKSKKKSVQKASAEETAGIPKSMVLALGTSLKNKSLAQLVRDFRLVMQPHTAINLRERRANNLKDFVVMAGPLAVSDLFVFKQSEASGNVSLRIGKMPKGPCLQFKVNSYSLMKDIRHMLKHPKTVGRQLPAFIQPPLLVMNGFSRNFDTMENHEKLMITILQNMFPPIQPHQTKVSTIQRVLLINKTADGRLEMRHYAITTKLVEESRNIKKLLNAHHDIKRALPKMSLHSDISELVLDPYSVGGLTSDSEVEDNEVVEVHNSEVKHVSRRGATGSTRKRAIKLHELGPRLDLSLVKIEENILGASKTIYHANVKKLAAEVKELDKRHEVRRAEKAERRAAQMKNVEAKQAKKDAKKQRKLARKNGGSGGAEEAGESSGDDEGSGDDEPQINPSDYENDSDLFSD